VRIALGVLGLASIGYGALLLLDNPWPILLRIAIWAAAGVLLHDFVFAPVVAAFGFAGRRLLPRAWWAPLGVAGLVSVVLVALAVPVFDRPGARPTNPTVLDRDYPLGLWLALALTWVVTLLFLGIRRVSNRSATEITPKSPVGEDEVVEGQGADDVGRQPPAP
jgi:hypothetical protein